MTVTRVEVQTFFLFFRVYSVYSAVSCATGCVRRCVPMCVVTMLYRTENMTSKNCREWAVQTDKGHGGGQFVRSSDRVIGFARVD